MFALLQVPTDFKQLTDQNLGIAYGLAEMYLLALGSDAVVTSSASTHGYIISALHASFYADTMLFGTHTPTAEQLSELTLAIRPLRYYVKWRWPEASNLDHDTKHMRVDPQATIVTHPSAERAYDCVRGESQELPAPVILTWLHDHMHQFSPQCQSVWKERKGLRTVWGNDIPV